MFWHLGQTNTICMGLVHSARKSRSSSFLSKNRKTTNFNQKLVNLFSSGEGKHRSGSAWCHVRRLLVSSCSLHLSADSHHHHWTTPWGEFSSAVRGAMFCFLVESLLPTADTLSHKTTFLSCKQLTLILHSLLLPLDPAVDVARNWICSVCVGSFTKNCLSETLGPVHIGCGGHYRRQNAICGTQCYQWECSHSSRPTLSNHICLAACFLNTDEMWTNFLFSPHHLEGNEHLHEENVSFPLRKVEN